MKVAVTSISFSKNAKLRTELLAYYPEAFFNEKGEKLSDTKLIDFIGEASAAIVGLEMMSKEVLQKCPNLKFISKYGVGLDNLDQQACAEQGIRIGWTGGVNRLSVAEMALGFMLASCRNLFQTSFLHKQGTWHKNGGYQLSQKTVGIIGVGFIGKEVIRLLAPFQCRILVNDIIEQPTYYQENGLIEASKQEIFEQADIISIHTPLTEQTRGLINEQSLSLMKTSAFVINTARGEIVEQAALKKFLQEKRISGAALDVYEQEPPTDKDFLALPNLICTPHIGGNSQEAVLAMGRSAIKNLVEILLN